MIRLHRHDEIVEAMARAIRRTFRAHMSLEPTEDDGWQTYRSEATAALDAMLEAVVGLEVGEEGNHVIGNWSVEGTVPALILKLEPTR
jgi:hypothetical protein